MFLMAQPPHYTHVTKQTFSLHEGKGYVALSGMSFSSQQSVLRSVSLFELLKIRLSGPWVFMFCMLKHSTRWLLGREFLACCNGR